MSNRKLKQQHLRDQSALTPPTTVPVVDPPVPVPMPSGSNIIAAVEAVKQAFLVVGQLTVLSQKDRKALTKMHIGGERYISVMAQLASEYPGLAPGRIDPADMQKRLDSVIEMRLLRGTIVTGLRAVDDYILQTLSDDWRDALDIYSAAQRRVSDIPELGALIAAMGAFLVSGRAKTKAQPGTPATPASSVAPSTAATSSAATSPAPVTNGATSQPSASAPAATPSVATPSVATPSTSSTASSTPAATA